MISETILLGPKRHPGFARVARVEETLNFVFNLLEPVLAADVDIDDACYGCGVCVMRFGCAAMVAQQILRSAGIATTS